MEAVKWAQENGLISNEATTLDMEKFLDVLFKYHQKFIEVN